LSSEYKSESKTSTGSTLLLYTSLPLSPPPLLSSLSPIDSPPHYNNMSQVNLHEIICQQQEQLAAMQVQIQALLVAGGAKKRMMGSNMRPQMEVAKPSVFNRRSRKSGRIHDHIQIILEDEDERSNSGGTSPMGPLICAGGISRCVEGKCNGGTRSRRDRI